MERLAYISPYPIPSIKADAAQDVAMCRAFSELGWEVKLFHLPARGDHPLEQTDVFQHYGVTPTFATRPARIGGLDFLFRLVAGPSRWQARAFAALDVLRSTWLAMSAIPGNFAVYYTRDPVAALALSAVGKRTIWEAMSYPDRLRIRFARWILRSRGPVSVVAITKGLAADLQQLGTAVQVKALPIGVDIRRYDAIPASPAECRRQAGIGSDRPLVVYTGWLRKDRGVDVVIRAAAGLPQANFVIAGGRPAEIEELRRLAASIGAENVHFLGVLPPSRIPLLQRAADVLVLPQVGSNRHLQAHVSPAKLFEYMAAGRPIVAADLPCIKEIVVHNENGLLAKSDDPEAWTQAICLCLSDTATADRLAKAGLNLAPEYDWRQRAEYLAGIIENGGISERSVRPQ